MNRYQHKRVVGCLRKAKLNDSEKAFLVSIKDKTIAIWLEPDPEPLSDNQNHLLNQISSRVGG